jgi:hypothetical protein
MPQKNRRQQRRPRRNSESTSLLLVMGESTAKPEIVSIHDNSQYGVTGTDALIVG